MLKLNIWASPPCFVYTPQARRSLWSHLPRCYHLVHQPSLTSGWGSHVPSNVLGRAGKSWDFELHCWPRSACPLHPPHRLLCSCHWCNESEGLSRTGSLGSNVGTCSVRL